VTYLNATFISRQQNEAQLSELLGSLCPACEVEIRTVDKTQDGLHRYCYLQRVFLTARREFTRFEKTKRGEEQRRHIGAYSPVWHKRRRRELKLVVRGDVP
jgi:hypothetical protein